jgi:serine/threonine protein kinase
VTNGNVRLADFGIEALVKEKIKEHFNGEPNKCDDSERHFLYMSPELLNQEICNESTDIWSFGLILNEMITNKKAYTSAHSIAKREHIAFYGQLGIFHIVHWEYVTIISCHSLSLIFQPSFNPFFSIY